MEAALTIAAEEWRYWYRTKLGAVAVMLAMALICISLLATLNQIADEKQTREPLQLKAEKTFLDQPARHPHRMVHYGHYVFRAPTSLAALDPGVDPYTGTVIFLEGHRQNSATFSPNYDGAQAGPFARLTPALSYQLLVPLVLIIIGFGAVARERESATDRQLLTFGVQPAQLWLGKSLALLGVAALMLMPLAIGILICGSEISIGIGFLLFYALYITIWVFIIVAISTWSKRAPSSLLSLLIIWTILCLLLPRLIASMANVVVPTASQIESDMDVIVALRKVGDGHNANDPTFNKLRASILEEYGVDNIEDLPINYRGVVAQVAEAELTDILNDYAERRMASQLAQTNFVKSLEFISPFLLLQSASMIAAGTDGQTHHRFLREAEAVRFAFVQDLNKVHEEQLAYSDDINRSVDSVSEQRSRVDAGNWRVLNDFRFQADPPGHRVSRIMPSLIISVIWLIAIALFGIFGARRLTEIDHG